MSNNAKQICPPFASGGGGPRFECKVQAAFVVLMLTEGIIPCIQRSWPIKEIQLQTKRKGANFDDFMVIVQEPNTERIARMYAQVKRTITISDAKSNSMFAEVIQAAWNDFTAAAFNRGEDALVLITRQLTQTDMSGVQEMLDWAKTRPSASEFFTDIKMAKLSDEPKRKKLEIFRVQLKVANGGTDVSEEETHAFLRHFHLIGFDLDIKSGVSATLLKSHISQYSTPDIDGVWAQLYDEVGHYNQTGGSITWECLPESITESFTTLRKITRAPGFVQSGNEQLTPEQSETMAFATLLGGWSESSDGDKEVIAQLVAEDD